MNKTFANDILSKLLKTFSSMFTYGPVKGVSLSLTVASLAAWVEWAIPGEATLAINRTVIAKTAEPKKLPHSHEFFSSERLTDVIDVYDIEKNRFKANGKTEIQFVTNW